MRGLRYAVAAAISAASSSALTVPPMCRGPPRPTTLGPWLASWRPRAERSLRRMSDDAPSDSSAEDFYASDDYAINVDSEPYEPTASEAAVTSVLDELPADTTSLDVDSTTRAKINEALVKLEALNPTANPTCSPLLNGVWSLRYAGGHSSDWAVPSPTRQLALFLYSGGYSPGLFALSLAQKLPSALVDIGDLEISISREQPRVQARVDVKLLGGSKNEVLVTARLDIDSGVRMTETYESATVLGQTIDLPAQAQYARDLYVTYVDEDILVVRDASGVPEVLVRKSKDFFMSGPEPDEVDDISAPY